MVLPEIQRIREAIVMDPTMAMDTSRRVAQMFNQMDAWRHLPGYRLEGRLAPFFELFLFDILGEQLGRDIELHPILIPEFPLRIGTLYSKQELEKKRSKAGRAPHENQSYNVDYVAFSHDRKEVFLVELKTDMGSRRPEQDKYLLDAKHKPFRCFVCGAMQLARASKQKPKYLHLMHLLSNLGLVSIENGEKLNCLTFPKPRPGWNKAFDGVQLANSWESTGTKSRVVYIQPECKRDEPKHKTRYIGFSEVADTVEQRGDLGCKFANYLRKWTEDPGRRYPRTVAYRS